MICINKWILRLVKVENKIAKCAKFKTLFLLSLNVLFNCYLRSNCNKNMRFIKVFLYMKAFSYDFCCFLPMLFYDIFNSVSTLSRRFFGNLPGLVIYPDISDTHKPIKKVCFLFGVLRCFQQSFSYISYQHFWSIYPDTSASVAVLITHTHCDKCKNSSSWLISKSVCCTCVW